MEVVANNCLAGDQRLVDKIVYELKSQGIFDQFRKECFADVDTKPAYQNLRQRVEGSVSGFLREQSWRPDMNKNQVREMLRKKITESGFLETGVERIVDQVVNPKISTVFLPKVEEVVYSYLGLKKPSRSEAPKQEQIDLLPNDLEAVSPESEPIDKKDDKSGDNLQDLDESKTEEDESPPFEPLDEQHEENSVDSHLSGFSGLISHESDQSNENKVAQMEQDSQMSRNSSESRLSIVTSDENSKMDICEDSQSKSVKSVESNSVKQEEKSKHKAQEKSSDKHKSRSDSKYEKDRRSSKDSKSRHSSSSKDKNRKKDSKSSSKGDKKSEKERSRSSSTRHSSSSKDKSAKKSDKERSEKDKEKSRTSSGHKDSKPRDKSSDSKSKSSSSDKHKHSSHSDRHKKDKDKDKKKDPKSKDDHYSSKEKKNDRRSTDRDSNDGQSGKTGHHNASTENRSSQSQKGSQEPTQGTGDAGNSDQTESSTTKAPVVVTGVMDGAEISLSETQRVKVFKPKCASNIQEAMKLMKIRKQLAKLEKKNQLSLASVDVSSSVLLSSSIDIDDLKPNGLKSTKKAADIEMVPSPLQNTVISQDNWDAMEAKLRQEVCSEFMEEDSAEDCKYFDSVNIKDIEFLRFVERLTKNMKPSKKAQKRKVDDPDLKNNNNKKSKVDTRPKKKPTRKNNNTMDAAPNEKFSLPLSPAESDKSIGRKEETSIAPLKPKRNNLLSSQRYSSDDLYKPRPTFASSRRRGAKILEN